MLRVGRRKLYQKKQNQKESHWIGKNIIPGTVNPKYYTTQMEMERPTAPPSSPSNFIIPSTLNGDFQSCALPSTDAFLGQEEESEEELQFSTPPPRSHHEEINLSEFTKDFIKIQKKVNKIQLELEKFLIFQKCSDNKKAIFLLKKELLVKLVSDLRILHSVVQDITYDL